MTEAELIAAIRGLARTIRSERREATDAENAQSLAWKRDLAALRNPPPPPAPLTRDEMLAQRELEQIRAKVQSQDLSLPEINKLLRNGGIF
jgi:hypothetical protein